MGEPRRHPLRRLVRLVCLLATAAVVALPMLLGPATAPVLRLLAGEAKHVCACGMKAGECGCPECERLEAERLDAHRAHPFVVLRSSCDSDDAPIPSAAPLPPAVAPVLARVHAPEAERAPLVAFAADVRPRDRNRPETPPPRSIAQS